MNSQEIPIPAMWWDEDIPRTVMILFFTDVIDIEWNMVTS